MRLSEDNKKTLFLSLHQAIEQHAGRTADQLSEADLTDLLIYPPNAGFTKDEEQALMQFKSDNNLRTALRKILADNAATVVYELLNLIDGTSDPDQELGEWSGIALVDLNDDVEENDELLHDAFFETFRDWKEIRPEKGWELDTIDE